MTHYYACVWLDHRGAKIFGISDSDFDETDIRDHHSPKHIHRKADHVGLGKVGPTDAFFAEIAEVLQPYRAILVVGPGTTRNEFAGTPAYSPPEAIRRRELTDKTDQFALGVMLFEMLSGVNPFSQCSTLTETLMVMEQRRYPRLSSLTPNLSVEVADVIARALDPKPEARHASVDELARALAGACGKPELALMELPASR